MCCGANASLWLIIALIQAARENALTLLDQPVAFDDLVLLSVEFIGRGTIQPRIGVIRPIDDGLVQP